MTEACFGIQNAGKKFYALDVGFMIGTTIGLGMFLFLMLTCQHGDLETRWFGMGVFPAFFLFFTLIFGLSGIILHELPSDEKSGFHNITETMGGAVIFASIIPYLLVILPFYVLPDNHANAVQKIDRQESECRYISELATGGDISISETGVLTLELDSGEKYEIRKWQRGGRNQCELIRNDR